MTPNEAEAEAQAMGLGSLAKEPDKNAFDPMTEKHWTLAMAAAWIAFRSADAVCEWWDEFRQECSNWRFQLWRVGPDGPIIEGHFLERRALATLAQFQMMQRIELQSDQDAKYSMVPDEAIEALWSALRVPCFEASGIDMRTGKRVTIPAEQWRDLEWVEERGRDVVRPADTRLTGVAQYQDITVPMRGVVGFWPIRSKPKLQLPELMKPEGSGYMPLFCAAQWIATEGGAVSFDPGDRFGWMRVFGSLLVRIASEEVPVLGLRKGEREPVPAYHFVDCPVCYPFDDDRTQVISSNELYLQSYPYTGEEHWRNGLDDSLRDYRGPRWSRLMANKEDVRRLWPFGSEAVSRTGAPGRPSCMHYVAAEFDRRRERLALEPSLARESQVLRDWVTIEHPHEKLPTAKTIENRIRHAYREAMHPRK